MPLFFLISGYLFKSKRQVVPYLRKLLKRYIAPYFVLAFCMFVIMTIKGGSALISHHIIGIVYSRGTVEWMPMCSPLWFLTCLTVALFIFNIILHVQNKWIQCVLIMLCGLISYYLDLSNCFKLAWNLDTALMANVFLYIGFLASKSKDLLFK